MLHVGDLAPNFTLRDEHGKVITLAAYQGVHPVVLVFYPGDETPICTAQLCTIRDDYAHYAKAGAVVFGINPANSLSHQRFAERYQFPFRLLVDHDLHVASQYGAIFGFSALRVTQRTVYVIGKDGRINFAQPGVPSTALILQAIRSSRLERAIG